MDTGKGKFEKMDVDDGTPPGMVETMMKAMEEKHPQHGGWFRVGETLEIRGSVFMVKAVTPTKLVLKLKRRGA
jgi:hypothetical protein